MIDDNQLTTLWDGQNNSSSAFSGSETAADLNPTNAKSVTVKAIWNATYGFDYTGAERTFTVPTAGYYKLEVWGAQGGYGKFAGYSKYGGYGGYSIGIVNLSSNDKIYINVGGMGRTYNVVDGTSTVTEQNGLSYNGGGYGASRNGSGGLSGGDGGGATHIAKISGLLKNLSAYFSNENILIVAGGGGGGMQYGPNGDYVNWTGYGGHGGGIKGNAASNITDIFYCAPTGAGQTSTGYYTTGSQISNCNDHMYNTFGGFGYGGGNPSVPNGTSGYYSGGGAGLYGSYGGVHSAAGGGSGYIGASNLISSGSITKHMTCYSCATSSDANTRTHSNTNVSDTAMSDYSKTGNGFARITYLGKSI